MIYLDNSATTEPCEAAVLAMREMLEEMWHNPSALYRQAIAVEKKIAACRETIADALCAKPAEVVFTSSGTESDSLAILGSTGRLRKPSRVLLFQAEHSAVRRTAEELVRMGHRVDLIPATDEGRIDLAALSESLTPEVALVSCMQVNNETGAVQPLEEVAGLLRKKSPDAVLHVDGVQGFLRVPTDLRRMGIDLYAISAHKIHGPKGVGALVCGPRAKLLPRVAGGGQERGLRSGTENTAGIAGLAAAVRWIGGQGGVERLRAFKLRIFDGLVAGMPGLRVNGPSPDSEASAPHILNVSFEGVGGEVMLHALEAEGVLVSTGAACSSKKRAMSSAFEAMRAPAWAAESAVRVSVGFLNRLEEADEAAKAMLRCYTKHKDIRRK